jgi:hypothetical protein
VIPSAWVSLSEEGLERTVMIIGASDRNISTLGLPTTSNLALSSEEARRQAGASSKEKASDHSSTDTGRGILAFSREPGDDRSSPQGRQIIFISSMRVVEL